MPALETPAIKPGFIAPDFLLTATTGHEYRYSDIAMENGALIMFICNHCPFVRAIIDRIVRDANQLQDIGIGVAAIMSNDVRNYPEDSFENMKLFAGKHRFTFPYLLDETQNVARAYGAVCTPDFFGFNAQGVLQYRGRLDASRMEPVPGAKRELYEAMKMVAETGKGPAEQMSSIGCSIKWKEEAA